MTDKVGMCDKYITVNDSASSVQNDPESCYRESRIKVTTPNCDTYLDATLQNFEQ